jgi:hypothetical protein
MNDSGETSVCAKKRVITKKKREVRTNHDKTYDRKRAAAGRLKKRNCFI